MRGRDRCIAGVHSLYVGFGSFTTKAAKPHVGLCSALPPKADK